MTDPVESSDYIDTRDRLFGLIADDMEAKRRAPVATPKVRPALDRGAALIRYHLQNADISPSDREELASLADQLDAMAAAAGRPARAVATPPAEPAQPATCEHGSTMPHEDSDFLTGKTVSCPGPVVEPQKESVLAIHGHNGATVIEFQDEVSGG